MSVLCITERSTEVSTEGRGERSRAGRRLLGGKAKTEGEGRMAGLDADVEEVELVMTSARLGEENVGVEGAAKEEAEVRKRSARPGERKLTRTERR
jgi:hypothetical protein